MKRALCIGINDYPGINSDLGGCVNDARDWAHELGKRGFEVTLMLDAQAKKAAMVHAIGELVRSTREGDSVVITYSGHGTWVPDDDGDEPDGRDEALCPYDITSEPLLDDELLELFSERHPRARVVLISDSCHSGSVARFGVARAGTRRVRFLPPEVFLSDPTELERARRVERAPSKGRSRGSALLLSGCQDLEVSWDASFEGRPNGAFTRAALDALQRLPSSATYADWYKAIRARLPTAEYPQSPNLVATRTQKRWAVLS